MPKCQDANGQGKVANPPKKGSTALEILRDVDLTGVYILITGCNTGIGLETARALALYSAHVTMANRNLEASKKVEELVKSEKPNANISTIKLDLTDFQSVERCASEYLASEKPLHALILNAGVWDPPQKISDAGFETTFQVNHLAQMHFTNLLLDRLVSSAPSRVVVVSSGGHMMTTLPKDPEKWWEFFSPSEKNVPSDPFVRYQASKLASVMWASELDKRMRDQGVNAYSLHPGVMKTDLFRNGYGTILVKVLAMTVGKLTEISNEQGAATAVYCATAKGLETHGGKYFDQLELKPASSSARNEANWRPVYQLFEQMLESYKNKQSSIHL